MSYLDLNYFPNEIDCLSKLKKIDNVSVLKSESECCEAVEAAMDYHNLLFRNYVTSMMEVTTDQMRRYAYRMSHMVMEDGDEWGQPQVQKCSTGCTLGFPLERSRIILTWHKEYFSEITPSVLAAELEFVFEANWKQLYKNLANALFYPNENMEYVDKLYNMLNLPIRPLLNGDYQPIPMSPQGEDFQNPHSHFSASNKLSLDIIHAVINNVVEHDTGTKIQIHIGPHISSYRAFSRLINKDQFDHLLNNPLREYLGKMKAQYTPKRPGVHNDFKVCDLDGKYEVWVKPWVPENTFCVIDTGQDETALVFRTRQGGINADLRLRYENEMHPLRCLSATQDYGIGVWIRHMAAVHQWGQEQYKYERV